MPYSKPRKVGASYVLPKKEGGMHRSSKGAVIHYASKESARRAGRAIMASEHGWKPKKRA